MNDFAAPTTPRIVINVFTMNAKGSSPGLPNFTQNVNRLFATCQRVVANSNPPTLAPMTNYEVADLMTQAGCPATAPWLSQVRNGQATNPQATKVAALAKVFNVEVAYFFDPVATERINATLDAALEELRAAIGAGTTAD